MHINVQHNQIVNNQNSFKLHWSELDQIYISITNAQRQLSALSANTAADGAAKFKIVQPLYFTEKKNSVKLEKWKKLVELWNKLIYLWNDIIYL